MLLLSLYERAKGKDVNTSDKHAFKHDAFCNKRTFDDNYKSKLSSGNTEGKPFDVFIKKKSMFNFIDIKF